MKFIFRSTFWYLSDEGEAQRTLCFDGAEEMSYTGNGFPCSSFDFGFELSHAFVFDYLSYSFFVEQFFSGMYRS